MRHLRVRVLAQVHAGAAQRGVQLGRLLVRGIGAADLLAQVLFQQVEDALAQRLVAVDVLDALEDGGDIVAAAGIDFDFRDGDLAQRDVGVMHDFHGSF